MNENPLVSLSRRTWQHSRGRRGTVIVFLVLFVTAELVELFIEPFLWARVMNVIQQQGITLASIRTLQWLLFLTVACSVTFWSFHGPARCMEKANAFRVRVAYRRHLLQGIMTLPMEWHADHHSGDTIDKVQKGSGALFEFSKDSFEIIYSLVELFGSYAVLVYFSPPAAVIVLGMLLASAWITTRFDRVLVGQYRELNHAENSVSEGVFDAISNISTVIILRVEKLVFDAIVRKMESPYRLQVRNNLLNECKWFLTSVCCAVTTVVVLGVYLRQNIGTKGVLVGTVFLLIQYLQKISNLFYRFTSMYGNIIQRHSRVLNADELSVEFRSESFTNHVLPPTWHTLDVAGLSFSYPGNGDGELHLDDVRVMVSRAERIAFIGASGSGKTTLLKIMRDLYHPQSLSLAVDGVPVPNGFAGIARAIALVPQNPEIFATTIRDNITLGADYEPSFVRRFTDMACFTDVVASLPRQLDSSIREKGVNLSGGQQQRLALARGLLACHDKDIVLLDEPTSSLDTANEMRIYRNIFSEFRDKTIISSVHRLHLLPMFDRIYLFSEGRIVAEGTLAQLLNTCTEFQELWQHYHLTST